MRYMTHVRTSPYYPQSNGKIERWHRSITSECIRPGTPLSVDDAVRLIKGYVRHYNEARLHRAIGYATPVDKLRPIVVATSRSLLTEIVSSTEGREPPAGGSGPAASSWLT